MNYNLVYQSSNFEINLIFILITILVIFSLSYHFIMIDIKNKLMKVSSIVIIFFITLSLYGVYEKNKLSNFIEDSMKFKKYDVVEGKIKKFHIMPKSGHDYESFEVNNKYFEIVYTGNYPDVKTLYYTLTKNRKGPIKYNGQQVKIYYLRIDGKNKIIKMWIE